MPVRPLTQPADALSARPREPCAANANALAQRFAGADRQIEKRVRRVDNDGASGLGRGVGDELSAKLRRQFGRLIGFRLILRW